MRDRIKSVLNYKKPAFWMLVAAVVVCIVVVIGFMTNPINEVSYGESYVRIDWSGDNEELFWYLTQKSPVTNEYPVGRIDTKDELEGFIEALNASMGTMDRNESFVEAISGYDETFFQEHSLVFAYIKEGSGSYRHRIAKQTITEEAVTLEIERIVPDAGSDDMAGWLMLHEMEDVQLDNRKLTAYRQGIEHGAPVEAKKRSVVVTDEYTTCAGVDIRMTEFTFGDGVPLATLEFQNYTGKALTFGEEYHVYYALKDSKYDCSKGAQEWESILNYLQGVTPSRQIKLWGQDLSLEMHYYLEFEFSLEEGEEAYTACVEFDIVHDTYDTEFVGSDGFDSIDFKGEISGVGDTYILVMPFEGETVDKRKIRVDVEHLYNYEELLAGLSAGDKVRVFYNPISADENGTRIKATDVYEAGNSLYYWDRLRVPWNEEDMEAFWKNAENKAYYYDEKAQHLPIQKLDTWEEWQALREEISAMRTDSLIDDKLAMYDEGFFEEKSLLLTYVSSGSGSIEYNVESMVVDNYNVEIHMKESIPEYCTCDMAAWLFMAAVEKDDVENSADFDVVLTSDAISSIEDWERVEAVSTLCHISSTEVGKDIWGESVPMLRIQNPAELEKIDYITVDNQWGYDIGMDYAQLISKYDENYFAENELFFVIFSAANISDRYRVDNVVCDGEQLVVQIVEEYVMISLPVSATWLAVIEVPKEAVQDCTSFEAQVLDYTDINQ